MRLDKFLANAGIGTRSEVKQYIRKGLIQVNGISAEKADLVVDKDKDQISFRDQPVNDTSFGYYMMNKPRGVISATEDNFQQTVLDLLKDLPEKNLFPVGRLDKDTEGLLLLTNDGALAHRLLSPKKHVSKTYYAKIEGAVGDQDIHAFHQGLRIADDFTALPANLKVLVSGPVSEIEVEIFEGKFHQIKRMFQSLNKKVLYLKRLSMGPLTLDPHLAPGEYRSLTDRELSLLQKRFSS